jgi:hypothetical protein
MHYVIVASGNQRVPSAIQIPVFRSWFPSGARITDMGCFSNKTPGESNYSI